MSESLTLEHAGAFIFLFFFAVAGWPFLRRAKSRLSQKIGHDIYSSDTRYILLLKIQTPQIRKTDIRVKVCIVHSIPNGLCVNIFRKQF